MGKKKGKATEADAQRKAQIEKEKAKLAENESWLAGAGAVEVAPESQLAFSATERSGSLGSDGGLMSALDALGGADDEEAAPAEMHGGQPSGRANDGEEGVAAAQATCPPPALPSRRLIPPRSAGSAPPCCSASLPTATPGRAPRARGGPLRRVRPHG